MIVLLVLLAQGFLSITSRRSRHGSTDAVEPVVDAKAGDIPLSDHDATKMGMSTMTVHPISTSDAQPDPGISSDDDASLPPSLSFSLNEHHRHRSIAMFWGLIVFDSVATPIALYYGLWYHTSLSPNVIFTIVTVMVGGAALFDYGLRFWRLFRRKSDCRPLGSSSRFHLDFFHFCFTIMGLIVIAELVVGTCFTNPPIRLIAMPLASVVYTFSIAFAMLDLCRWRNIPLPIRVSSQARGSIPKSSIYFIIEDVVAVDGGADNDYRRRLLKRYEASPVFRAMLERVGVFWWTGGLVMASVTTALVFTIPKDPAYVVGWSAPFVWAGIWAWATIMYVRKQLKVELETWSVQTRETGLEIAVVA